MRDLAKALGATLVALLLLAAPSAQAAAGRSFSSSLTGKDTPAKGFDDACGLALSGGQTYVSDYFHHVIDRFSPSGTYEAQRTKVDPLNGPCGLAADSAGTLYVNDFREDVRRFSASEFLSGVGTTIDAANSTGVAVDPATNRAYVDDRTYIAVYEPSGEPVEEGGEPLRLGEGELGGAYGVAVSGFAGTAGDVYVADAASDTVKVFDPAGNQIDEIDGTGTPQGGFTSLVDASLAVDPTNGHLLVVDNTQPGFGEPAAVVDEFNSQGAYRGQLQHPITDALPSGLAVDGAGHAYVTSGNAEGASVLAFGAISPGHLLSVTEAGTGAGSVTSSLAGIACGSACTAEYDEGVRVSLTPTADRSSTFAGWSGCGAVSGDECIVTLGADRAVTANFAAIPQQTLSLTRTGPGTVTSTPARISCGSECVASFNEGASVLLNAVPTESSTFAGFTGCDRQPAADECEVTMDAASAVEAHFTPIPQQQLSVTRAGAGKGAITGSSPGAEFTAIDCGGTCVADYNQGQEILLTAHPGEGQELSSWTGCDSQPSAEECLVAMGAARAVTADFEPVPSFRLTVATRGSGTGVVASSPGGISCGAACAASFPQGEAVVLTATPASGSSFAGWSGGCSGTGPCKVVLGADTEVLANFSTPAVAPPAPTVPALALGRVAPHGAGANLVVDVPAAGTLSAAGKYLKPVSMKVAGAGSETLKLALSKAGIEAREATKHNRLQIKVTVTFDPKGTGAAQTLARRITFAKPPRRKGGATLTQKGDLFASFNGGILPAALPRNTLAPISVNVEGKVKSIGSGSSAALSKIEIAINRHGHLDTKGLPTCPQRRIVSANTATALAACGPALVGEGSFAAHLSFEGQPSFPSRGHLLAFNATEGGRPVILVHVYGTQPIPITRLLVFTIHHTSGAYGTVLSSTLPESATTRASIKFIGLTLHRTYIYRGHPHSYLSADCPAPSGFAGAAFALVHASMTFSNASTLDATVIRNCKVSQ